ncbi:MAG: PEP/pyruvate-binding domain-containing protein [Dehalococcoidia bacterium]
MGTYIYHLEDAPDDEALVGGKAAGLTRLLRWGLPVPPGFVLTVPGFKAFLHANGLGAQLASVTENAGPETEAAVIALFRAAPWPEDLRSTLEGTYQSLCERAGESAAAVRSSATAEDSAGASFAGQHLTLLNVVGVDALRDGVLCCWASLYGATALHYRHARGVDEEPAMAVVVQALVPAEAAGVAFTLDPVSGDRETMVIEAAWGLGEGVVSGMVTPDHYAVRKADGAVVRRQVAEKEVQVTSVAGGGTRNEALSGQRVSEAVLSDDRIAELARLALRVEEEAGVPQDIEWALAGGKLYLLQARPITAAGAAPVAEEQEAEWVSEFDTEGQPHTVWTSANVQEVLPDQLSPFNCSITLKMLDEYGLESIERMGIRLKNADPFSAMFYGRPFLNVNMTCEVADQIPFGSVDGIMEQYYDIPREILPQATGLSPAKLWRYLNTTPRMLWFTMRYPAETRRAEKICDEFERELAEQHFLQLSDAELMGTIVEGLGPAADVAITHVSGAGLTSSTFDMLRRLTKNWLGDETGSLQATLCSGLASVESAQPAYELWDLSRLVVASDALRHAFEPRDGAEIEGLLAPLEGEAVAAFRARLQEFLKRHGHRSVMEAEIAAKSWEEDLPTVYAMIRNYLHARDSADPRAIEEHQRREREAATQDALRRLSWWRRTVFRRVLAQAQNGVTSREHTKSLLVRGTNRGRRLSRELARRLASRGLLDDVGDFYYLTLEDAQALVSGEMSRNQIYVEIRRRKREEARNQDVVLPETFQGRPKPLRRADMPFPDGHTLHGIPVSPGRVTGPARVILDPRIDAVIEPGEILVAPVTDAGWTPLFVAAAGIVVDVGGTLSHGSTVAREYGLPAVVNVKHGTRMIRTGQTITVDGSEGIVVLED